MDGELDFPSFREEGFASGQKIVTCSRDRR
jgi:hypothetical protein